MRECPECLGSGEDCDTCDGTGEVQLEDIHAIVKDIEFIEEIAEVVHKGEYEKVR